MAVVVQAVVAAVQVAVGGVQHLLQRQLGRLPGCSSCTAHLAPASQRQVRLAHGRIARVRLHMVSMIHSPHLIAVVPRLVPAVRVLAAELGLALREWTDNGPRGGAAAAGSGGLPFAPGAPASRGGRFGKGSRPRGSRGDDGDDDGAGVASVVAGLYHARLHDDETAGASSSSTGAAGAYASGQSVPYASVLTLFRDFMGRSALYKTLALTPATASCGGAAPAAAAAPRGALSMVANGGRKSGGSAGGSRSVAAQATNASASASATAGHLLLLEDLPRTQGGSYSGGLDRDTKEEVRCKRHRH